MRSIVLAIDDNCETGDSWIVRKNRDYVSLISEKYMHTYSIVEQYMKIMINELYQ